MNKELIYRLIGASIAVLAVISLIYDATIALWIGGVSVVVAVLIYLMWYKTDDDQKGGVKGETVKKMKSAIGLLIVAIVMGVLLYHSLANYLINRWLMAPRHAWIVISVLLPFFITAAWLIFKDILPGELASIRSGSVAVLIVVVAILGYSYLSLPNDFFDHKTGASKFWIDDKTGVSYPSPGYSPITGIQLREGTSADAQKYLKTESPSVQNQQPTNVHSRLVIVEEYKWTLIDIGSDWVKVDPTVPGKVLRIKLENGQEFEKRDGRLFRQNGKEIRCLGKSVGLHIFLAAGKGEDAIKVLVSTWPKDSLDMLDGKECEEAD